MSRGFQVRAAPGGGSDLPPPLASQAGMPRPAGNPPSPKSMGWLQTTILLLAGGGTDLSLHFHRLFRRRLSLQATSRPPQCRRHPGRGARAGGAVLHPQPQHRPGRRHVPVCRADAGAGGPAARGGDDRIFGRALLRQLEEAARKLRDRLEPVTVAWALGRERRISYNRTGRRADGSTCMRDEDRVLLGADFNGDIDDEARRWSASSAPTAAPFMLPGAVHRPSPRLLPSGKTGRVRRLSPGGLR